MTLSYIFFGTNRRDPAEHTCPWLNITPESAPGIARDKSASGKIMFGDLPPSSKVTRFKDSDACRIICLPTGVEPVNAILSTSG